MHTVAVLGAGVSWHVTGRLGVWAALQLVLAPVHPRFELRVGGAQFFVNGLQDPVRCDTNASPLQPGLDVPENALLLDAPLAYWARDLGPLLLTTAVLGLVALAAWRDARGG